MSQTLFLVAISLCFLTIFFIGNINRTGQTVEQDSEIFQKEFIDQLVPKARELKDTHGIRPSVLIAQAILESDWGRSDLALSANNLFGIKAHGDGVDYQTKEYSEKEGWSEIKASFKEYASFEESMEDYANLLHNGTDWNPTLYHPVLYAADYQEAAQRIAEAGYATDPDYSEKIIAIIQKYELNQYDE